MKKRQPNIQDYRVSWLLILKLSRTRTFGGLLNIKNEAQNFFGKSLYFNTHFRLGKVRVRIAGILRRNRSPQGIEACF